jgi:hypothetical protein
MPEFTKRVSRSTQLEPVESQELGTGVAKYSKRRLGDGFQTWIEQRLAATLSGFDLGSRVERSTVRFEDLNGPKGGIDTSCRIQLIVSGQRSLVVEGRAEDPKRAFRVALTKLVAALDRQLKRRAAKPRDSLRTSFRLAS